MSDDALIERVRTLAEAFIETDLLRLRIEAENEDAVELRKPHSAPARKPTAAEAAAMEPQPAVKPDRIKADLVGILHFTRPLVHEGDRLDGDRELAHVEALGIRNPVRSLGGGRVASVRCKDGQAVEYGQVLFEIERG
jgi:biotin carboxyl carrier protein